MPDGDATRLNSSSPAQPEAGSATPAGAAVLTIEPPRSGLLAAFSRLGQTLGGLLGHAAIPEMAAALAYRTIFSLIPILLIAFLTLRLFKDTGALVEQMLSRLLEQAGLTSLAGNAGAGAASGGFDLKGWISQRVNEFSGINFTWIGLISAGVLIYGAMGLLVAMEGSFNAIYGGQNARSWSKRLLQYWMIITLGPMLVYASFFAGEAFKSIALDLAENTGVGASLFAAIAGYATTVLISAALLLALYQTIPNTRVRLRPAIIGSLVGGLLLEMAKNGFSIYVQYAGVRSLYGSLALLPLFLFWVYITWIIVLFGLRLSYLIQHQRLSLLLLAWRGVLRRHLDSPVAAAMPEQAAGPLMLDRTVGLCVLAHIGDAFNRGQIGLTPEQIEAKAAIPHAAARTVIDALIASGLVIRATAPSARSGRLTLSRPPASITAAEAIRALDGAVIEARGIGGTDRLTSAISSAAQHSAGGLTLADLIDPPAAPAGRSVVGGAGGGETPPVPA